MNIEPNEMMMELFRSEVELHSESLTASLLALEHDATISTTLERLMRAAHSIKGAARIVRVDPAVDVAHAMEDCIVAAQNGKLKLTSEDVDILLRGVDVLIKISAATKDPQTDWSSFENPVRAVVAEIKGILTGAPNRTVANPQIAASGSPPSPAPVTSAPTVHLERASPGNSPAVIKCPEILDRGAAEGARRELLSALAAGSRELQLDLAATRDLDAVGLAFLAAARRHVAALPPATLRFQPVSEAMRTVLQVTGLDAPATEIRAQ